MIQTSDGGYLFLGNTVGGHGSRDVFLVKLTNAGWLEWKYKYHVQYHDEGYAVREMPGGGFVVAGRSHTYQAVDNILNLRVNADGSGYFAYVYPLKGNDVAYGVAVRDDGSVLMTGSTESLGAGQQDLFITRLPLVGPPFWFKTYGWGRSEQGRDIEVTSEGGIAVAGWTEGETLEQLKAQAVPPKPWLVKTDTEGVFQWSRVYGTSLNAGIAQSLDQAEDGGYLLTGTGQVGSQTDIYAIKTDGFGMTSWQEPNDPPCQIGLEPGVKKHTLPAWYFDVRVEKYAGWKSPLDQEDPYEVIQDLFCISCTPCPLEAAWQGSGVERGVEDDYYWFRDAVLSKTVTGQAVIDDYYEASAGITRALLGDFGLLVDAASVSVDFAGCILALRANPDDTQVIPSSLYNDTLALGVRISKAVDGKTAATLSPWLDQVEENPIGLLEDLNIPAKMGK